MISLGAITGKTGKDVEDLLDLLKNADKYEKHLKELKHTEESAVKARQELTKAKDLDAELKLVATLKAQAKELKDKAQTHFDDVVKKAEAERSKILSEANTVAAVTLNDADDAKRKADDLLEQAKTNKSQADQALLDAEKQQAQAIKARDEALALKREYEAKLRNLDQLIKQAGI